MLTEEEFKARWRRISKRGRKFIIRYIENGLDANDAAWYAGFKGCYINSSSRPLRKYNDLIEYLLKKNNIIATFVKPEWVLNEYRKIYDNTNSEITKVNILNQLSKILSMINNTEVKIENNIPQTPVIIKFSENE